MSDANRHQFGTFGGVFTPSVLTILGAIMFMRANFVTGHAGILGAVAILLLAKGISLLTTLSVSAIATNMQVRGGGAYFLISRVLGPEFGGSIGVVFFFAQALSVPFYVLGFSEALISTVPALEPHFLLVAVTTAAALFVIAWVGAGWSIKTQFVIMAVLGISVFALLGGAALAFDPSTFSANLQPDYGLIPAAGGDRYNFWLIFAIYFPAATGFLAGVNMSGDLKDPARSIPLGTFLAIGTGFVVYLAVILINGGAYPRQDLISRPFEIMVTNAALGTGFLVAAGVYAATLSSTLSSYLGAPRVLQAVARDKLLGFIHPFGRGSIKGDEPRQALLLTGFITLFTLAWAGGQGGGQAFNIVASVITMFFLYTYGMLNLAAFTEAVGNNPSFRPRFRLFHWSAALLGAVACGAVAFLIDPLPAVAAFAIIGTLYWYLWRKQLSTAYGDARRGYLFSRVRSGLLRLKQHAEDPKNWRPTILAFSGNPNVREVLVAYAVWLEAGCGIVLLVNIIKGNPLTSTTHHLLARKQLSAFLSKTNLQAFPLTLVAENVAHGIASVLQASCLGPIRPNLALFGWHGDESDLSSFRTYLGIAEQMQMSLVLIQARSLPHPETRKRIDVWWRGRKNGALMLLLAHLMSRNWEWASSLIRVVRVVDSSEGRVPARRALVDLIEKARVDAEPYVIFSEEQFCEVLQTHSGDADCVFLGFEMPDEETLEEWHAAYQQMMTRMNGPTVILVNSSGREDILA